MEKEEKTYRVDIEVIKTKNAWKGKSWIHNVSNEVIVTGETATDVLDSLMVNLKNTLGVVLDSKGKRLKK